MDKDILDTSYFLGQKFGLADIYATRYLSPIGSTSKRRPRAGYGQPSKVKRRLETDRRSGSGSGVEDPSKRIRAEPAMDRVVAGNSSVKQRASTKRKLKSGRVGRKLQKQTDEVLLRWQRIYNYGQNTTAYPADVTQATGDESGGRIQLSHFTTGSPDTQVNVLPVYLWDLTSWKTENIDGTVPTEPRVCCRLQFNGSNQPSWRSVFTQYQTHELVGNSSWQLERSNLEDSHGFPRPQERKALLKWSDMRFCFYGARQHPTRIVMELIQFNDSKYSMDFHAGGEAFTNQNVVDQQDVRAFWLEECKKLVYHPLDVQNFQRQKAIKSLYRESFQIAPDDTTNADVCPPNVVKRIFKRFNRLVNWDWETPPVTDDTGVEANKNELETPAFQVGYQTNLKPFADPRARIYLYIRAEDMDPVPSNAPLHKPAVPAGVPVIGDTLTLSGNTAAALVTKIESSVDNPTPTGTYICGYDFQNYFGSSDHVAMRVPKYCATPAVPAEWSTTTTPSFDIVIRQKWSLQQ